MKRILILAAAAMGLLVASCQKVELVDNSAVENVKAYTHYLTATVEDNAETRVGFDENGAFYWHDGDVIGVLDIVDTVYAISPMELIGDEEATEPVNPKRGRFGGDLMGEFGGYALYPYDAAHMISNDSLYFNMPAPAVSYGDDIDVDERDAKFSIPVAMLGQVNDETVYFKHMASFFKIIVSNAQAGDEVVFEAVNQKITGEFVTMLTDEVPVLTTSAIDAEATDEAKSESKVSVYLEQTGTAIIYIPAPLGTYERIEMTINGADGRSHTKVWSNQTLTRCTPKKGYLSIDSAQAELQAALDRGGDVILGMTVELSEAPLFITKDVTLDLCGSDIVAGVFGIKNGNTVIGDTHSYAFWVKDGATLTIKNSTEVVGTVSAEANATEENIAVYVENGSVVISGGNFINQRYDNSTNGYASPLVKIVDGSLKIEGGNFMPAYDFVNEAYKTYQGSSVSVNGGVFYGTDPVAETETNYTALGIHMDKKLDVDYSYTPAGATRPTTVEAVVERYNNFKVVKNEEIAETLAEALAATDTVGLVRPLEIDVLTVEEYCGVLDLDEKELKGRIVIDGGSLTVANGTIKADGTAVIKNVKGNVNIHNMIINHANGTEAAVVNDNGSLTIDFDTEITSDFMCISSTGTLVESKSINTRAVIIPDTEADDYEPLKIEGVNPYTNTSVSINGGTYNNSHSTNPVISIGQNSALELTDATLTGNGSGVETKKSTANITDTEFNTGGSPIAVADSYLTYSNCDMQSNAPDLDMTGDTGSQINSSVTSYGNGESPVYVITADHIKNIFSYGGEITLTEEQTNVADDITVAAETGSVTIDLSGKTLTLATLTVNNDVTFINGTLNADKIDVAATGSLTFTDVVYTGTNEMTVNGEMNVTGGALATKMTVDGGVLSLNEVDLTKFTVTKVNKGQVVYTVATADELVAALETNCDVVFKNDIKINPASMSNAYGKTGINVKNGQSINGNGNTIDIKGAGGTWDSGINTTGGLIENITVTGSFRGIFINHNSNHSEKVVLDNVTIDGTVYTISCDEGKYQNLEAYNSTFKGWTSYAKTIGTVLFDSCYFGEGSGYAFCRPYAPTQFVNCNFEKGFKIDCLAAVTFENCSLNGVAITAENLSTLVIGGIDKATVK